MSEGGRPGVKTSPLSVARSSLIESRTISPWTLPFMSTFSLLFQFSVETKNKYIFHRKVRTTSNIVDDNALSKGGFYPYTSLISRRPPTLPADCTLTRLSTIERRSERSEPVLRN